MLCFKFHKNRTINEEFDFFEGNGSPHGVRGLPFINLYLNYFCKYMKMLCFKFHKNRPINEEFDFFDGGGEGSPGGEGAPINKYLSQL